MSETMTKFEAACRAACEWCAARFALCDCGAATKTPRHHRDLHYIHADQDGPKYPCTAPDLATWAEEQAIGREAAEARVLELSESNKCLALSSNYWVKRAGEAEAERDSLVKRLEGVRGCFICLGRGDIAGERCSNCVNGVVVPKGDA